MRPKMRLALRSICALALDDKLPAATCCVARAFAFAAWLASGIGYLREPGRPNSPLGIAFLALPESFPTVGLVDSNLFGVAPAALAAQPVAVEQPTLDGVA